MGASTVGILAELNLPSGRTFAVASAVLCSVIAIALWFAGRSKWGQNKPLTNCIILAVLAHVWLLMYAYGTRMSTNIRGPGHGAAGSPATIFEFSDVPTEPDFEAENSDEPPNLLDSHTNTPTSTSEESIEAPSLLVQTPQQSDSLLTSVETVDTVAATSDPNPQEISSEPLVEEAGREDAIEPRRENVAAINDSANEVQNQPESTMGIDAHTDLTARDGIETVISPEIPPAVAQNTQPADIPSEYTAQLGSKQIRVVLATPSVSKPRVAPEYQLRFAENRLQIISQLGGDEGTEAAVESALAWLASNQESDGRWDAAQHGAGRETRTMERDRAGTGAKADTGMTALSLLCFLGSGHTHLNGKYANTVAAGLRFLIQSQMPSGDLAGVKQIGSGSDVRFARMYCHGMALLAMAEAYNLTGDPQLLEPLQRGAGYTLRAQNPQTGGWRYDAFATGDPGDMSQFGWQAMALHSCENAGIQLPAGSNERMHGFLQRVTTGRDGGLAVYHPVPGQLPTLAMTAESFALKQMLSFPLTQPARREATSAILQSRPGQSEENLYYWYYATLALFPSQDEAWTLWNEDLKLHLKKSQSLTAGYEFGSWPPKCIWAGYGGRVYSTALSCLTLQVYYRYLPILQPDSYLANSHLANPLPPR